MLALISGTAWEIVGHCIRPFKFLSGQRELWARHSLFGRRFRPLPFFHHGEVASEAADPQPYGRLGVLLFYHAFDGTTVVNSQQCANNKSTSSRFHPQKPHDIVCTRGKSWRRNYEERARNWMPNDAECRATQRLPGRTSGIKTKRFCKGHLPLLQDSTSAHGPESRQLSVQFTTPCGQINVLVSLC